MLHKYLVGILITKNIYKANNKDTTTNNLTIKIPQE